MYTWEDHDEGSSQAAQWTDHVLNLRHKQRQDKGQDKPDARLSPSPGPLHSAVPLSDSTATSVGAFTGCILTAELYELHDDAVNSQPAVVV